MTLRLKLATACLILVLGALALPSLAQQPDYSGDAPSPAPYRVGERLTYTVSFSNFVSAAHIDMLVAARGTFFGRDGIQLKGHVETTGVVNAALFAINNDYITYIDAVSGLPYQSQQTIREASRTAESSAEFNQPAGTAAIPARRTGEVTGTYDLLSAIYRIRALPLTEGSSYELTASNDNQSFQLEIHVSGHEMVKTNIGSVNTIVSQVRIRSASDSYNLRAYFTDDQRHVPVLILTKRSVGLIQIDLAGSGFVATPKPVATPTPAVQPAAQPSGTPARIPATTGTDEADVSKLPFKVGEQLTYQVFLPNIQAPVATATFHVRSRSKYFDHDGFLFNLNAQTTNALQKVFAANDTITSYVDPTTLLPFQSEMMFNEGRRRFRTKLTINQDYGSATTESGSKIEIPVGTHDYLSFFYVIRTFALNPPKRNAIPILVNNQPRTLFLTAQKRETIQIGSQSIPAILITLTTDDAQGDKYQLRTWISDDKRRLPLRLTAMTEMGLLRADLAILPLTSQ